MPPASITATMVDLAFPIAGTALPREYRLALAEALLGLLPWLAAAPGAGVHRINAAAGNAQRSLLSRRSRLVLRVARNRVDEVSALAGRRLDVAGDAITLAGPPSVREMLPHGTLYAYAVQAGGDDESGFLASIEAELDALGVRCRRICGRAQALLQPQAGQASFSLMLDGLMPDDALRVLETGLGTHRLFGCGLFVPHKSAAAVGS